MLIDKNGVQFNVDRNTGVLSDWDFWSFVVKDVWEPHTFKILQRFLEKDKVYVDIGAWIGPTVLFGSQLSKHCFAFEPDPSAYNNLQTNLSLNPNITNVSVYESAIGAQNGLIAIGTRSSQGDSMSSLLFSENSWEVESVTIEEAFRKHNITDCNFIKMDIEGGEYFVLPATKEFILKMQPTMYIALHTGWVPDKKVFFDNIKDVLSPYKNVYSNSGNKISLDNLKTLPHFTEILATNLDW